MTPLKRSSALNWEQNLSAIREASAGSKIGYDEHNRQFVVIEANRESPAAITSDAITVAARIAAFSKSHVERFTPEDRETIFSVFSQLTSTLTNYEEPKFSYHLTYQLQKNLHDVERIFQTQEIVDKPPAENDFHDNPNKTLLTIDKDNILVTAHFLDKNRKLTKKEYCAGSFRTITQPIDEVRSRIRLEKLNFSENPPTQEELKKYPDGYCISFTEPSFEKDQILISCLDDKGMLKREMGVDPAVFTGINESRLQTRLLIYKAMSVVREINASRPPFKLQWRWAFVGGDIPANTFYLTIGKSVNVLNLDSGQLERMTLDTNFPHDQMVEIIKSLIEICLSRNLERKKS